MYPPYTHSNANEPPNPLAYLATRNNTSPNSHNPAHSQPSPYVNSDISFSTLASVSALSLTSNLDNDYRASRPYFRPEGSFGNVSRPASVWSESNDDFQQPTNPLRHVGAGRFWAPSDETATTRANGWRRLSGRAGGAEIDRPPPPARFDEEMLRDDRASTTMPWDSAFSRPPMDDAASFVSSVGSSGLSRQSSSVASVRSLRARDSAPSNLIVSKPMSLADRIAVNERRKRTQEMLRNLHEEEEQKAQLAAIEEDEMVLPKPEEQHPVSRRASSASNRGSMQPQQTASPRVEGSSPTRNFPATDEFADTKDVTKWNEGSQDPLQELLRRDKDMHRDDLKDPGVVVEDEEVQGEDSSNLPEEPARASEPPTNQQPLPNAYELHNQWNDSFELQENIRKPSPSPKPVAERLHSQWNEPHELQHTKSTKAPRPPPNPTAAELPHRWTEPVELQHIEATKKSVKKAPRPPPKPKPAEVPAPTVITTPELDSTYPQPPSVFELEASIFADTDSIINRLPTHNRTPALTRTEPANPPTSTRGTNSWLSQHPQSNYSHPRALYAELPAATHPVPPPYTPYTPHLPPARHPSPLPPTPRQPPHSHPPIPHRASAPLPPPYTFELSTSSSVLHRSRHRAVHEVHRTMRHHSDLTVYNTLQGEPYPLMPEEGRVELPARPYETDRRDLYSWDNCPVEMGGGRNVDVRPDSEVWAGRPWTG